MVTYGKESSMELVLTNRCFQVLERGVAGSPNL
jgi:hypothetical protein